MSRTYTREMRDGAVCEVATDALGRSWAVDVLLLDVMAGPKPEDRRAYVDQELDKAIARGTKR